MTLIVGMKCHTSVVIGSEQEESEGYFIKRNVRKLKLYSDQVWALGFAGAGDAAIVDRAEGFLSEWLEDRSDFTHAEIANSIEDILGIVHTKFIDPDAHSEGVALMVGGVCGEGLFLLKTSRRTSHFVNDYGCIGIGKDIPTYLLDHLYDDKDKWCDASRIAAFVLGEGKRSSQGCGGESDFLVFQKSPSPRWRDLGSILGLEVFNEFQDLISNARSKLVEKSWRLEAESDYADEFSPDGDSPLSVIEGRDDGSDESTAARKVEMQRLDSLDT